MHIVYASNRFVHVGIPYSPFFSSRNTCTDMQPVRINAATYSKMKFLESYESLIPNNASIQLKISLLPPKHHRFSLSYKSNDPRKDLTNAML